MSSDIVMIGIGAAVLASYWFIHLARRYRLPSVVLLLVAGILLRVVTHWQHNSLILPPQVIPMLGTAGLVLIVLEGALDLRLEPGRRAFLLRTFGAAGLGIACTVLAVSFALKFVFDLSWLSALIVAAPFGVISSTVAIPSAESLDGEDREFVIYESSWSDIFGVMFFNAILVSAAGGEVATHLLGGGLTVIFAGALIALAFYWLVGHLQGQVKFTPLLFALILIYACADSLHLSPLLIVLILGLALNNSHLLRRFKVLARLHSNHYEAELERLKHLTSEATFLIRTFFFLLLGYVTDLSTFADPRAWAFSLMIVAIVFVLRWAMLSLLNRGRTLPLLWAAPRGLITATLFFSTPQHLVPVELPPGTLILVILLSCLVMAFGLKAHGKQESEPVNTDGAKL